MQQDKETAVLKANYKHQILLNIRLDRIEKCKKTYESFHSFEVAVMKRRRDRILRTQSELKRMKVKMAGDGLDSEFNTRGSFIGNVQGEIYSVEMMKPDHVMEKSEHSVYTQLSSRREKVVEVPMGSEKDIYNTKHIKEPSFIFSRSLVNGGTTEDAPFLARAATNITYGGTSVESRKCSVKFPGLTTALTPSPVPNATHNQDPRRPDACSSSQTHAVNSDKVRTSTSYSRNSTNGKSRYRDIADDISPFERFRVKLQESAERSWKYKVPARSISAVNAMRKGSVTSAVSTVHRRSRSAVIQ